MVTKVNEPSKYGVVVMEETTGKVEKFVEKPKVFVGNKINAGIYLLNSSVLDRIELKPTSIEREVFLSLRQRISCMLGASWVLDGHRTTKGLYNWPEIVSGFLAKRLSSKLATGSNIFGNVLVDESAEIGDGCRIGPDVAIGPGCIIEPGVRLSRCTVMRGVPIRNMLASPVASLVGIPPLEGGLEWKI